MVLGVVLCERLIFKGFCNVVFSESLCSSRSKVWPIGSKPVVNRWLHICGIGLYVVMRAYICRWSGYLESVGLCLCN